MSLYNTYTIEPKIQDHQVPASKKQKHREQQKRYLDKLKSDDGTWKNFLHKNAVRNKKNRQNKTLEEKDRDRVLSRIRQRRFKEKHKDKLSKKKKSKKVEEMTEAQREKYRSYWREKQRSNRESMSELKRKELCEKAKYYRQLKQGECSKFLPNNISLNTAESPRLTRSAKEKGINKIRKVNRESKESFEDYFKNIQNDDSNYDAEPVPHSQTKENHGNNTRNQVRSKSVSEVFGPLENNNICETNSSSNHNSTNDSRDELYSNMDKNSSFSDTQDCSNSDMLDQSHNDLKRKAFEMEEEDDDDDCQIQDPDYDVDSHKKLSGTSFEKTFIMNHTHKSSLDRNSSKINASSSTNTCCNEHLSSNNTITHNTDCYEDNCDYSEKSQEAICISLLTQTQISTQLVFDCQCDDCLNTELMMKSVNEYFQVNKMEDLKLENLATAIDSTLCRATGTITYYNRGCIERKCKRCGISKFLDKYKELLFSKEKDKVTWGQWKNNPSREHQQEHGPIRKLIELLSGSIFSLASHFHTAIWQNDQFYVLRKNIPSGMLIMVLDDHVAYEKMLNGKMTKILIVPIVCLYKCLSCKEIVKEDIIQFVLNPSCNYMNELISFAVSQLMSTGCFVNTLVQFVNSFIPWYRSYDSLEYLSSTHDKDYTTIRNFFIPFKQKNVCQEICTEIGNVLKNLEDVSSAEELFVGCKNMLLKGQPVLSSSQSSACLHSRKCFYLNKSNSTTGGSFPSFKELSGITDEYMIRSTGNNNILKVRALSCFCNNCIMDKPCTNHNYLSASRIVSLNDNDYDGEILEASDMLKNLTGKGYSTHSYESNEITTNMDAQELIVQNSQGHYILNGDILEQHFIPGDIIQGLTEENMLGFNMNLINNKRNLNDNERDSDTLVRDVPLNEVTPENTVDFDEDSFIESNNFNNTEGVLEYITEYIRNQDVGRQSSEHNRLVTISNVVKSYSECSNNQDNSKHYVLKAINHNKSESVDSVLNNLVDEVVEPDMKNRISSRGEYNSRLCNGELQVCNSKTPSKNEGNTKEYSLFNSNSKSIPKQTLDQFIKSYNYNCKSSRPKANNTSTVEIINQVEPPAPPINDTSLPVSNDIPTKEHYENSLADTSSYEDRSDTDTSNEPPLIPDIVDPDVFRISDLDYYQGQLLIKKLNNQKKFLPMLSELSRKIVPPTFTVINEDEPELGYYNYQPSIQDNFNELPLDSESEEIHPSFDSMPYSEYLAKLSNLVKEKASNETIQGPDSGQKSSSSINLPNAAKSSSTNENSNISSNLNESSIADREKCSSFSPDGLSSNRLVIDLPTETLNNQINSFEDRNINTSQLDNQTTLISVLTEHESFTSEISKEKKSVSIEDAENEFANRPDDDDSGNSTDDESPEGSPLRIIVPDEIEEFVHLTNVGEDNEFAYDDYTNKDIIGEFQREEDEFDMPYNNDIEVESPDNTSKEFDIPDYNLNEDYTEKYSEFLRENESSGTKNIAEFHDSYFSVSREKIDISSYGIDLEDSSTNSPLSPDNAEATSDFDNSNLATKKDESEPLGIASQTLQQCSSSKIILEKNTSAVANLENEAIDVSKLEKEVYVIEKNISVVRYLEKEVPAATNLEKEISFLSTLEEVPTVSTSEQVISTAQTIEQEVPAGATLSQEIPDMEIPKHEVSAIETPTVETFEQEVVAVATLEKGAPSLKAFEQDVFDVAPLELEVSAEISPEQETPDVQTLKNTAIAMTTFEQKTILDTFEQESIPVATLDQEVLAMTTIEHEVLALTTLENEITAVATPEHEVPIVATLEHEVPIVATPGHEIPIVATPEHEVPVVTTPEHEVSVVTTLEHEVPVVSTLEKEVSTFATPEKEVIVRTTFERITAVTNFDREISTVVSPGREASISAIEETQENSNLDAIVESNNFNSDIALILKEIKAFPDYHSTKYQCEDTFIEAEKTALEHNYNNFNRIFKQNKDEHFIRMNEHDIVTTSSGSKCQTVISNIPLVNQKELEHESSNQSDPDITICETNINCEQRNKVIGFENSNSLASPIISDSDSTIQNNSNDMEQCTAEGDFIVNFEERQQRPLENSHSINYNQYKNKASKRKLYVPKKIQIYDEVLPVVNVPKLEMLSENDQDTSPLQCTCEEFNISEVTYIGLLLKAHYLQICPYHGPLLPQKSTTSPVKNRIIPSEKESNTFRVPFIIKRKRRSTEETEDSESYCHIRKKPRSCSYTHRNLSREKVHSKSPKKSKKKIKHYSHDESHEPYKYKPSSKHFILSKNRSRYYNHVPSYKKKANISDNFSGRYNHSYAEQVMEISKHKSKRHKESRRKKKHKHSEKRKWVRTESPEPKYSKKKKRKIARDSLNFSIAEYSQVSLPLGRELGHQNSLKSHSDIYLQNKRYNNYTVIKGRWLAVVLNGQWFPGTVIKILRGNFVQINFLETSGNDYVWPEIPNILSIHYKHLYACWLTSPLPINQRTMRFLECEISKASNFCNLIKMEFPLKR